MNQKNSEKKEVENLVCPLTERKTAKIIRYTQHNTKIKTYVYQFDTIAQNFESKKMKAKMKPLQISFDKVAKSQRKLRRNWLANVSLSQYKDPLYSN